MSGRRPNRFREAFRGGAGRPMVVAHRGDSFHAPENTLEAARIGHRRGADAWEFDVRLTRDGVPIVLHDDSLLRTTDVAEAFPGDPRADLGYLAAEFDLDEIRRLDAGSWFLRPEGGPRAARGFGTDGGLDPADRARFASGLVRVPTLEEALALTAGLDWMANVELKTASDGDPRLAEAVIATIGRLGAADRVLASSFDHPEVARVAASAPSVATGVLVAWPLHRPAEYVRGLVGANAYHVAAASLGLGVASDRRGGSTGIPRADVLAECRRAGIPVLVYTVNADGAGGQAGHLADAGVSGLFTDDPTSAVRLFTPCGGHTRIPGDEIERPSAGPRGPTTAPESR